LSDKNLRPGFLEAKPGLENDRSVGQGSKTIIYAD